MPLGHRAAHRCRRRRGLARAGAGGRAHGRHRRLRAARRLDGALLVAAGYEDGVCFDPRDEAAAALADELGWAVGDLPAALACDIVNCITPGSAIVVERDDLATGRHLNMLGADGSGKAEASIDAVVACELFCDEWEQASHGGELAGAVAAGRVVRDRSRRSAPCSRATRPAAAAWTRSRCSIPPAWRSRISPSPPRRCAPRRPARCRRAAITL